MVGAESARAFLEEWRAAYVARFPARAEHAQWLVTRPGPPARQARAGDGA
jgi:hypothetical protein